jgi:hypothetical protein
MTYGCLIIFPLHTLRLCIMSPLRPRYPINSTFVFVSGLYDVLDFMTLFYLSTRYIFTYICACTSYFHFRTYFTAFPFFPSYLTQVVDNEEALAESR